MERRIILIDEEKCNGCGACAAACHEGAIAMVGGKAKLMREDYCDGLGDCLPACPTGAITFETREAPAYDAEAVKQARQGGCPGARAARLEGNACAPRSGSALRQWPVQIKLAPLRADYFDGAALLIAADCTAYAYGAFHADFMQGKITLIGCPKLDAAGDTEKLTAILSQNQIQSVTVARMEVPCCGGIEQAVRQAVQRCGRPLPLTVVTISRDGKLLAP